MEIIILLLLLLFGTRGQPTDEFPPYLDPTPTPSIVEEPTFISPTFVETATPIILESLPIQVELEVTGYQPDGCDFPVTVEQERNGNVITLSIYRELPLAVACPAVILPYEARIPLEGTFESGEYTIIVNDVEVSFGV